MVCARYRGKYLKGLVFLAEDGLAAVGQSDRLTIISRMGYKILIFSYKILIFRDSADPKMFAYYLNMAIFLNYNQ